METLEKNDSLVAPLVHRNRRLEDQIDAWLDLLDAAGLAAVCELGYGECLANATAHDQLEKDARSAVSLEEAAAILQEETVVPVLAEPGIVVWKPDADEPSCFSLDSLSPREREVSKWLREGNSAAEIGVILSISPRTVEKHVQQIYTKCGVSSQIEFIRLVSHGSI